MAFVIEPFLAFPRGPSLLNVPLQTPYGAVGMAARRLAEITSGALTNVDGLRIPYSALSSACSMNALEEVVPKPRLRGLAYHLWAVQTAPRYYV
jgi:hypothetical protein